MQTCFVCLQWRRGWQLPKSLECGCSVKAHTACLTVYASTTRSVACPICTKEIGQRAQRRCARKLISTLYSDLSALPAEAWGERARVLRHISRLHTALRQPDKATELFMSAQREGYYGCVAFALAKATETSDPNDILLAIHLATGVDERHMLSDWARSLPVSI